MKTFITIIFLVMVFNLTGQTFSDSKRALTLVFAIKDAPSKAKDFVIDNSDDFIENGGIIYYLSKGQKPFIVTNKGMVSEFINSLTETEISLPPGNVNFDINKICEEIIKFRKFGYEQVNIYLLVNSEYLNMAFTDQDNLGRWLNFFPENITVALSSNQNADITTKTTIISNGLDTQKMNALKQELSFGTGRFKSKNKIEFVQIP